jgi:hypothetical protein
VSKVHCIIDMDFVKYSAAAVGEKRTIVVTHKVTGWTAPFKNRTEFYGVGGKKDRGWIGERNAKRSQDFIEAAHFDIQDVQEAGNVKAALASVDRQFEMILSMAGTKSYKGYIGKGDSFRVDLAKIIKYKGNRDGTQKPLNMDAVIDHILTKWGAEVITGIEADDQCVIDCIGQNVLAGVDKDYYGCPVEFLDVKLGKKFNCNQFGALFLNPEGPKKKMKVRGHGRMFQYFQLASGDSSDNYCANSAAPDKPWADMGAYHALKDCKTDAEAWEAVVAVYRNLYPETFQFTGWTGEVLQLDWAAVLQENYDMARMLTHPTDFNVKFLDTMQSYGT